MVGENVEAMKRREMLRSRIDSNSLEDLVDTDFVTVDPEMALSDVVAKMKSADLHEIPVMDKKKLLGVVSYGTMIRKRNMVVGMKAKNAMDIPPMITTGTPITEVAEQFIATGFRQLPVFKGKSFLGMVSRGSLIKLVKDIKEFRTVLVKDIMTAEVQAVEEKEAIKAALELMQRLDIRTVPVVDEDFKLVGIIGIRDIVNYSWQSTKGSKKGTYATSKDPVEITIKSLMHEDPVTVESSATLIDVVNLMGEHKISTIPVVDDGKIKGVITKYDILEMMAAVRERDMVYMQISGLEEEDRFSLDQMEKEIQAGLAKLSKLATPTLFTLHVQKYNPGGNRAKYSLSGRLSTKGATFTAKSVDWSLMKATVDLMNKLDKMALDGKENKVEKKKRTQ
jgi:CBS domain-containing protein